MIQEIAIPASPYSQLPSVFAIQFLILLSAIYGSEGEK